MNDSGGRMTMSESAHPFCYPFLNLYMNRVIHGGPRETKTWADSVRLMKSNLENQRVRLHLRRCRLAKGCSLFFFLISLISSEPFGGWIREITCCICYCSAIACPRSMFVYPTAVSGHTLHTNLFGCWYIIKNRLRRWPFIQKTDMKWMTWLHNPFPSVLLPCDNIMMSSATLHQ